MKGQSSVTSSSGVARMTGQFGRLSSLLMRKRELDDAIDAEQTRPAPCNIALQRMKKRRLALKDLIERSRRKSPRAAVRFFSREAT